MVSTGIKGAVEEDGSESIEGKNGGKEGVTEAFLNISCESSIKS